MSAAASRRRKQLLLKKKSQEELPSTTCKTTDPILLRRLNSLISDGTESSAYEALQLAQSQVRRYTKSNQHIDAANMSYQVSLQFLEKNRVSVSSQLLSLLLEVLMMEGKLDCTEEWVGRMETIDERYRGALEEMTKHAEETMGEKEKEGVMEEYERLMRLHYQFLKKVVKWSCDFGTIRYGDLKLHELLGEQCWRISLLMGEELEEEEELDELTLGPVGTRGEAVTHLALGEQPLRIIELLATLPPPTPDQEKTGRNGGTAAERDCHLTRAVLVLSAVENLRDANVLLRKFVDEIDVERDIQQLAKSYMNKTDGSAPTHVVFCCMLLRVCEKDRAGPLFQWLLRSFGNDLNKMKPDVKGYTTKIGKVYFGIMPPPSMMSMMENMLGMMGGGGMAGMMNPQMMAGMGRGAGN